MTGHPSAQILAEMAELAKTNPDFLSEYEWKAGEGEWRPCIDVLPLCGVIRRKPRTLRIGDREVIAPREINEVLGYVEGWNVGVYFDSKEDAQAYHAALTAQGVSDGN